MGTSAVEPRVGGRTGRTDRRHALPVAVRRSLVASIFRLGRVAVWMLALSWLPFLALVAQPTSDTSQMRTAQRSRPPAELAQAHAAQLRFEWLRRGWVGTYAGPEARCDVRIGRVCYWDNNGDPPAPPPRPELARERARLLDRLARAAAADPADAWTAGQRVRYLLEAGHPDSALAAARACAVEGWWCPALRGLALHEASEHAAAAAAFDSAVAAMPVAERCVWRDPSIWLEPGDARLLAQYPCDSAERERLERRLWRLAQPFWSLSANDLRNELDARRLMVHLHATAAHPQMRWGDDLAEVELRYGWPTAWSARPAPPTPYGGDAPSLVGHEPVPSIDPMPRPGRLREALERASALGVDGWVSGGELPRMRYAPRWARGGFSTLTAQLAQFRRGDTTMLAAAWSVVPDSVWRVGTLQASLVVADDTLGDLTTTHVDSMRATGTLAASFIADSGGLLASIEVFDGSRAHAARARRGMASLARSAALSDLLVFRPTDVPPRRLEDALPFALADLAVPAGGGMGLYWERYGAAAGGAGDTVRVLVERLDRGWADGLRRLVGADVVRRPVAVQYIEDRAPAGVGRYLAVRWPVVPVGRYRVEVAVTAPGGTITRRAVDVRVIEPGASAADRGSGDAAERAGTAAAGAPGGGG